MLNDTLSAAMSKIMNAEKTNKKTVDVKSSKIIKRVLQIMHDHGYIGEFKEINDGRGNIIEINLIGAINKCNAIKPRYSVTIPEYEKFEKRFLPAKDFGILIISTNKGIITHNEAINQNLGGRLIAYVY